MKNPKTYLNRFKSRWGIALLVIAAFAAGVFLRGSGRASNGDAHDSDMQMGGTGKAQTLWTCSMHPQIKLQKPGKCPLCAMDLIPLETGGEVGMSLRELSISEDAATLMELETAPVERKSVTADIRMVGKVDYDETRLAYITAWVPGRLDELFVDFTGVAVQKGDPLVSLYSPELLSAQEELLQAIRAVKDLENSNVSIVRETADATVDATREKLRLWGLTTEQIAKIEARGSVDDHVTIYSPSAGIVIHKNAQEGMYVKTGSRIYTIADISTVWVKMDAYESDLGWLKDGQLVQFTTESYPGEVFTGYITFIDPIMDQATRTAKVRVEVPNPELKLKPGMFVRATAHGEAAAEGTDKPLVIPDTAPLITGTRAIVYVEVPGKEMPTYEGREIVLGPRAGAWYLVRSGLREGERVVVNGQFKLDAELQIQAKPSMMTPEGGGGGGMAGMDHGEKKMDPEEMRTMAASQLKLPEIVQTQLREVVGAANQAVTAASGGDIDATRTAFVRLAETLESVDADSLTKPAGPLWREYAMLLGNDAFEGSSSKTVHDAARVATVLQGHLASMKKKMGLMTQMSKESAHD